MFRREFLRTSAALSAAAILPIPSFASNALGLEKIGIQFFSLPKLLDKDVHAALKLLSDIGFREAELYGPFPFSTQHAKDRWNAVTPSLGWSGSGFYGMPPKEFRAALAQHGLTVPSIHTDLDTLRKGMPALGEAGQQIGFTYIGLPAIPEEERKTLDDYKRLADEFNKIGAEAKKYGLRYAYHNHGYGLKEINGQIPLDIILNNTDPELVFFEMDLYWTTAGGANPVDYLNRYPNRYHLMHVKDMKEKVLFEGDGGNSKQWIALFPYMTTAGSGVLDLKNILTVAKKQGVKHFFVEQDMVANPEEALKKSFDYLHSL
ncbi:MAG: TIM barrel protein [Cyclobacteriaceae bacterium]